MHDEPRLHAAAEPLERAAGHGRRRLAGGQEDEPPLRRKRNGVRPRVQPSSFKTEVPENGPPRIGGPDRGAVEDRSVLAKGVPGR